ncbi:MAG: SagB/ThcOx family dehydrogenase [Betaproteobacteria bacterium]|nr:MAG: SagB/ThcOx family dehydrogenase [Betaproteobacteria bacterium]
MEMIGLISVLVALQTTDLGGVIRLREPTVTGGTALVEALAERRSVRQFESDLLSVEQIGQLLWAAQGITRKGLGFRTAPSAGALYPLETYVVLSEGVYHYNPRRHQLKRVIEGDKRRELQSAAWGQRAVGSAPAVFVFAAVYDRTSKKYGKRATRYVDMEAGHACQNLLLQAVALDLGGVPVGAFRDERVAEILDLGKNERPLYLVPVGYPAR